MSSRMLTIAIFGIVWQSARAVITRSLDGIDSGLLDEIRHAAEHVPGIDKVVDVKARWLGHKLHADVTIAVDNSLPLAKATEIAAALQSELHGYLPSLNAARVQFDTTPAEIGTTHAGAAHVHHYAPEPFVVDSPLAAGLLAIVDTAEGERMRLTVSRHIEGLGAVVRIRRPNDAMETLPLLPSATDHHSFQSSVAPAEPHAFDAELQLTGRDCHDVLPFRMTEPEGHHH
jgi:hypothetical protein